jgi:hypothetical protein
VDAAFQQTVGDFDVQPTGEPLISVRAGQAEPQLVVAEWFGVPELTVESGSAAVQAVASVVDVNGVALVVQVEATTGEPVGEPAYQAPEVRFFGGKIPM